jgi:hypothetical protein
MNRRVVLTAALSAIGVAVIALLLTLGNTASVPTPVTPGTAPAVIYPKGASDSNYTVLCIKKGNSKLRLTKSGPYATCPFDFETVPVQLDPKLIKK